MSITWYELFLLAPRDIRWKTCIINLGAGTVKTDAIQNKVMLCIMYKIY